MSKERKLSEVEKGEASEGNSDFPFRSVLALALGLSPLEVVTGLHNTFTII
jgi:hypothetical protein